MEYVNFWILTGLLNFLIVNSTKRGEFFLDKIRKKAPNYPEFIIQFGLFMVCVILGPLSLIQFYRNWVFRSKDSIEKRLREKELD